METPGSDGDYCDCPACEFDDPDADLGYLLYVDADYLTGSTSDQ